MARNKLLVLTGPHIVFILKLCLHKEKIDLNKYLYKIKYIYI